jgi:hypothetical protein
MAYGETLRMRNLPTGPRVRYVVEHTAPNRAMRRGREPMDPIKPGYAYGRNVPYVARNGGNR